MRLVSASAWLRPALTLLATAGLLSLAACGGGSGAPNNPYEPQPPTPAALTVVPTVGTAYAGTPLILSINGGAPPYQAFSSNPAVLPVQQNVTGNQLLLSANNVDADQTAVVSIRDSAGTSAVPVNITIKPSLLLPTSISVIPNTNCGTAQACSGQTSVALVNVRGAGGVPLAGKQVRFDVVQGQYSLQSNNPGAPLVQTLTVVSDQNGEARAVIAVPATAPSQFGVLRATELSTGSQVTGQFTIAQVVDGAGILSVVPNGKTTTNGPATGVCSSGVRVTYYIFGGVPPYRVGTQFPDAVSLIGVPVQSNGGSFDAVTNGTCFTGLTFAITDATGRTILDPTAIPTVDNVAGAQPSTPTVTPLQISPTSYAAAACTSGATTTFPFTLVGKPPFTFAASRAGVIYNANPITATPGQLLVSGIQPGTTTITVGDGNTPQQVQTLTINCP
jgi:hypothetical protein